MHTFVLEFIPVIMEVLEINYVVFSITHLVWSSVYASWGGGGEGGRGGGGGWRATSRNFPGLYNYSDQYSLLPDIKHMRYFDSYLSDNYNIIILFS